MSDEDVPQPTPTEATGSWTLTDRSGGFVLVLHPTRGARRKLIAGALRLGLLAALAIVLLDIRQARGIPFSAVAGMLPVLLIAGIAHARRTWKHEERVELHERRLTHVFFGPKNEETRTVHLGPTVEIETEPSHLADGIRYSLAQPVSALTLHTNGRTLAIGAGLHPSDAALLAEALTQRIAPEQRPIPGAAGQVYELHFPIQTGGYRQLRYVGRQRPMPIGTTGGLSSTILIASLIALLIGGVVTFARVVSGGAVVEWELTAAVVGLAGWATLAPRIGLFGRWRRSELSAARDGEHAAEPWTWHHRWPERRIECTAAHRLARTSALVGLPVVGGVIAWAGTPQSPYLIPLWVGLAALALIPMALYLWQLAFAGSTEVRVPDMPLVPGQRANVRFALHRDAAPFSSIAFRLVRAELRRSSDLIRFARYWTTHEGVYLLPSDTPAPGPNEEVSAVFDIPADAGGTDEESSPAIRWFLEVRGVTSAGPYIEAFPVPVFDAAPQA